MKKIDKRKKYIMVFDVETTNNIMESKFNDGLVYDIGYAIVDKQNNEYVAKSYVISDIFDNEKELMKSAYYVKKLPKYYKELENGTRQRKTIFQVRREVNEMIKKYNIKEVYAYNANFDITTLNNTCRYVSKSLVRYFFPYGVNVCCIWNIACQTLGTQKTFLKQNVCNEKGNLLTSAERMFAYISNNKDFQEEHTGLEDTRIESAILNKCFRQHKSIDKKINRACWQIPQKAKKELLASA